MSWHALCLNHKNQTFTKAILHWSENEKPHPGAELILASALEAKKMKKPIKHPSEDECWMCKELK